MKITLRRSAPNTQPTPGQTHHLLNVRQLVLVTVSVLIGLAVGWLTWKSTHNVAGAVLAGGTGFAGSLVQLHALTGP